MTIFFDIRCVKTFSMWVVRSRKVKTLTLLIIPFLLLVIIFILTVLHLSSDDDEGLEGTLEEGNEKFKTCYLEGDNVCRTCDLKTSFTSNMDVRAKPCQDFYKYVCGKPSKSFLSATETAENNFFDKIESRIKEGGEDRFVKFIGDFLGVCRRAKSDKKDRSAEVAEVLEKHIKIGTSPKFFESESITADFNWLDIAARSKVFLDMDLFFSINVVPSFEKKKYVLFISEQPQPSRLRRSPSTTHGDQIDVSTEEAQKLFLLKLLGKSSKSFSNALSIINKINEKLFELFDARVNFDEMECKTLEQFDVEFYNLVESSTLMKPATWVNFFDQLLADIVKTERVQLSTEICYNSDVMSYLVELSLWMRSLPGSHLELFTWYTVGFELLRYTFDFGKGVTSSQKEDICRDIVLHYLDIPLFYTFFPKNPYKIRKITQEVSESFLDKVSNTSWTNEKIFKRVSNKIGKMYSIIGYEETIADKNVFEHFLKNVSIPADSTIMNAIATVNEPSIMAMFHYFIKSYTGPWMLSMGTPFGATFKHELNTLLVHSGFLESPIYFGTDNLAETVLNYAVYGSLAGGKALAGFNWMGVHYNSYGQLGKPKNFLSDKTYRRIVEVKKCFARIYKGSTNCENKKVDLDEHYEEIMDDNAGVRFAYRAYKKLINKKGCFPSLPSIHLSDDKIFFIAFASYFCESEEKKCTKYNSKSIAPHVRLKNILQNNLDFAKAFKCKVGDSMRPRTKQCGLW